VKLLTFERTVAFSITMAALFFSQAASAAILTYDWVTVTEPRIAAVTDGTSTTTFDLIGRTTGTLQIDSSLSAGTYSFDSQQGPFTSLTNFSTPRSRVSVIYSLSFGSSYNVFRNDSISGSTPLRSFAGERGASALLVPLDSLAVDDFGFLNYFYNGASARIARGSLLVGSDNTLALDGFFGQRAGGLQASAQFESVNGYTNISGGESANGSTPTGLTGFWRLAGTNAIPGNVVVQVSTPSSIALLLISLVFMGRSGKRVAKKS
jgi:hypothetical protein